MPLIQIFFMQLIPSVNMHLITKFYLIWLESENFLVNNVFYLEKKCSKSKSKLITFMFKKLLPFLSEVVKWGMKKGFQEEICGYQLSDGF